VGCVSDCRSLHIIIDRPLTYRTTRRRSLWFSGGRLGKQAHPCPGSARQSHCHRFGLQPPHNPRRRQHCMGHAGIWSSMCTNRIASVAYFAGVSPRLPTDVRTCHSRQQVKPALHNADRGWSGQFRLSHRRWKDHPVDDEDCRCGFWRNRPDHGQPIRSREATDPVGQGGIGRAGVAASSCQTRGGVA